MILGLFTGLPTDDGIERVRCHTAAVWHHLRGAFSYPTFIY
jgi:hypothetical protein